MVFRVVTWIITVIIGTVRALCARCARAVRKRPQKPSVLAAALATHSVYLRAGTISWEMFVFQEGGERFPRRSLGVSAVPVKVPVALHAVRISTNVFVPGSRCRTRRATHPNVGWRASVPPGSTAVLRPRAAASATAAVCCVPENLIFSKNLPTLVL